MAVFMINICKFNGCGITFPNLGDLIQHIEDTHIDYDPLVIEQKEASQPSCIPLSYVIRFYTDSSRREQQIAAPVPEVRRRLVSVPKPPSLRSNTPTGSEFDDDDMMSGQSEDSNDSWTTVEEYSSEFILRYGSRINPSVQPLPSASASSCGAIDKPFACPVPGCKKRYKNVNGIKYHSKNGHKKDGKIKKPYKCNCGKSYKTAQGLKNHAVVHFSATPTQLHYNPNVSHHSTSSHHITHSHHSTSSRHSSSSRHSNSSHHSTSSQHTTQSHHSSHTVKPVQLPIPKTTIQSIIVSNPTSRLIDLDGNKVIRAVLESHKKEVTNVAFTIPKHSVAKLHIVNNNHNHSDNMELLDIDVNQNSSSHIGMNLANNLGILTPATSPGSSPIEKLKDRSQQHSVSCSPCNSDGNTYTQPS